MKTTRRNAMIVPNGQQRQHACRKHAMHCQVRTQNALPILDHTTGSNGFAPSVKELAGEETPCRSQSFHQRLLLWSQKLATLPGPSHQNRSIVQEILLFRRATMLHMASLKTVIVIFSTVSFREIFCKLARHLSHSFQGF
jgi:hypothetical protein